MKLNILKARSDGREHGFAFAFQPDESYFVGRHFAPGEVTGTVRLEGDDVLLAYELRCEMSGPCDNCASPASWRGEIRGEEVVRKQSGTAAEDGGYTYEGDEVDLGRILNEAVYWNAPAKLLCRPDCRGLCPQCGKNRNEGDCGCAQELADSPFAKLLELKNQSKTDGGK